MRQNRIKILCAQNDISIAELAKKIGMQPAALRRYTRHEALHQHNPDRYLNHPRNEVAAIHVIVGSYFS